MTVETAPRPRATRQRLPPLPRREDGGRSRVTAVVRLAATGLLFWNASSILGNPPGIALARGEPMSLLVTVATWQFAIAIFLLSGFMSRVCGLLLVCLAGWEIAQAGVGLLVLPIVLAAAGVYLTLRGGGAWAMDVYVQMMQDRIRQREALERERRQSAEGVDTGAAPGDERRGF